MKGLKWIFIFFSGLIVSLIIAYLVYFKIFYVQEMNEIEDDLNNIENVEVVNIWGHQDLTLEEISARISIKNKGEIVLYGLSEDSFDYPKWIPITEIGGYSFTSFSCNGGVGSNIGIGTENELGKFIGKEFNSVKEIVENYDLIIERIESLKMSLELNHFENNKNESYLLINKDITTDQDPIFNLLGIENKFEFAKTLRWSNPDCYWNE